MGRVIADGIAHNFGSEELVKAVNEVIDKGAGAQGYIDEAINTAMKRAQLAQLVSAGVEMFDYITQPGACDICEPLEGTYSLSDLPGCPQHFRCRCSIAPAGTI
jgi:SPP1 gp7 family putative phage head morphogenesis protein